MRQVLAALALACCNGALAQDAAERPVLQAGDEWHFAVYWTVPTAVPSRIWKVVSVGAGFIEATENGEPLRLTPSLGVLESPRTTETNPRTLDFPLATGKNWRYTNEGLLKEKRSRSTAQTEVRVAARERVKVPAGEFDAFKLEARAVLKGRSGIGSNIDAETKTTYWYAPDARSIVKSIHHNPYLGTSTTELVSYRLQP